MATELLPVTRQAVRDLLLVLADCKRLLGTRYANWMLGAPELEGGIALASMAQDEWGHGRLLYALLKDFGDDVDHLEHGREPADYCSIEALDSAPADWAGLVSLNVLVDTAFTVQFEAMHASSWLPLRQRVGKMLDEEQFHSAYGRAWADWFARSDEGSRMLHAAIAQHAPIVLRWFGPDSERSRALVDEGVVDASGSALRTRYVERVAALLHGFDLDGVLGGNTDFSGFNEACRRRSGTAPDAETIRHVRGDHNRAFLMD